MSPVPCVLKLRTLCRVQRLSLKQTRLQTFWRVLTISCRSLRTCHACPSAERGMGSPLLTDRASCCRSPLPWEGGASRNATSNASDSSDDEGTDVARPQFYAAGTPPLPPTHAVSKPADFTATHADSRGVQLPVHASAMPGAFQDEEEQDTSTVDADGTQEVCAQAEEQCLLEGQVVTWHLKCRSG